MFYIVVPRITFAPSNPLWSEQRAVIEERERERKRNEKENRKEKERETPSAIETLLVLAFVFSGDRKVRGGREISQQN